ncbi:hypothetical protein MTP99_007533 [Tenebrio molitor]|nr:hypothetical protein MTP99_007533 [Tenebrio molitor]
MYSSPTNRKQRPTTSYLVRPRLGPAKNTGPKYDNTSASSELMSFIEKQEDYIEQPEKESRFCREELSSVK